jgi:hypothetical protein
MWASRCTSTSKRVGSLQQCLNIFAPEPRVPTSSSKVRDQPLVRPPTNGARVDPKQFGNFAGTKDFIHADTCVGRQALHLGQNPWGMPWSTLRSNTSIWQYAHQWRRAPSTVRTSEITKFTSPVWSIRTSKSNLLVALVVRGVCDAEVLHDGA